MKFNASLIKTWMTCPLQAKFKEIEHREYKQNAKASFGTCMHEALDMFNTNGNTEAAIERFKITWNNPEILGVAPDYWPARMTFGGLRNSGIEILETYAKKNEWRKRTVLATEHKFCVPFGDHLLSGVVDLLEYRKDSKGVGKLMIVDYKTNSKQPNKMDLMLDIQFTSYVYASLQPEFWLGWEPEIEKYAPMENGQMYMDSLEGVDRRAMWYHLMTNKEIDAGPRDDNDFMRLYRVLEEIEKAVEKDVYVPSINGSSCTYCDYTDICKAVIPIRARLDQEIADLEVGVEIGTDRT